MATIISEGVEYTDPLGATWIGLDANAGRVDAVTFLKTSSAKPITGGKNPNGFTAGYNDPAATGTVLDTSTGLEYNYADMIQVGNPLAVSSVPRVLYDGQVHLAFLFDGNEPGGLLGLSSIDIGLAYSGGDVELQANTGTSRWDVVLLTPEDWFDDNAFINFEVEYIGEGGGADEWGIDLGFFEMPTVPEASSAVMIAVAGLVMVWRRWRAK